MHKYFASKNGTFQDALSSKRICLAEVATEDLMLTLTLMNRPAILIVVLDLDRVQIPDQYEIQWEIMDQWTTSQPFVC